MLKLLAVVLAAALSVCAASAQVPEVHGAGSTFVFPILTKWAEDYRKEKGNRIIYQPIGSGAGIAEIKSGAVDFAASDMPMKPENLARLGLGQFPLVIGGVVPVVNVDRVKPGELRFTGPVLAGIFLGKIKVWNDPAIQALNPDVKLPMAAITVVHRLDASGTTFNWVNYLAKVSLEWRVKVGEGTTVDWPVGLAGRGNDGVAGLITQTSNSIGYVEYAYVLLNHMVYGLVQNRAGAFVKPDAEGFQAAAESADWAEAKDFYLILTDAPGASAYPITATVFVLLRKQPTNPARAVVALDFFQWVLDKGHKQAAALDYVPLPLELVKLVAAYWKAQFEPGG